MYYGDDMKAENVYDLADCTCNIGGKCKNDVLSPEETGDYDGSCLTIENTLQFGIVLRFENKANLTKILRILQRNCKN